MSLIKITAFNGMTPRTDARLLEANMAQSAVNSKLQNGSIKPYKAPGIIKAFSKTGTIKSIYRFGQSVVGDADYWFQWTTDVNVVRGAVTGDTYERTYWTGDGVPKMTTNGIALTGGTSYPMNSYTLGIPDPFDDPTASLSGTGEGVAESRVYIYTYVSEFGEEGVPSNPSNSVAVQVGQSVVLSGMSAGPTGSYHIVTKRIYRSVMGTGATDYLFVAEIPVANDTFTDDVLAASLGEVCPSKNWSPPVAQLSGLTIMANGIMAGFYDKDLYFSEAYRPHAWPMAYNLQTDYPIVGIGAFGSSLLVTTTGNPYILSGTDPSGMTMTKGEFQQACVSKRSVVEMGGGVMYASPDGLVLVDGSGINLLTRSIMTKEDWQAYVPSSITASHLDGRYYAFFNTGTRTGCFVLDMTGDGAQFWESDQYATAAYNDIRADSLFVAHDTNICKWDSGSTDMSYVWHSKIFVLPKPENMGVAQVYATSYPLTFKAYAGGALVHTHTVANDRPFKLPSGVKNKEWEIEVAGTKTINAIYLAGSAQELKQA